MSLIYITGISGSGKSSISEELKRRGYEAHDADGEGFNSWVNNKTGEVITKDDSVEYGTPAWHEKYSWKTSRTKVEELARKAKDKIIFLSGVSSNEKDIWDLFTKVICLVIDEKNLRERIANRTTNTFGKKEYELRIILGWHKTYPGDYPKYGAIIVDASKPLHTVVDKIIKIVES